MTYRVKSFQRYANNLDHKIVLDIKKRRWFKVVWVTKVFWGSWAVWREFRDGSFFRCNTFMESLLCDIEYKHLHFNIKNLEEIK